jgi:hypothetical protein
VIPTSFWIIEETVMAELMLRPLSVGEIIDHSLAVYRRQFAPLALITLAANAIPILLGIFLLTSGGVTERPLLWVGTMALNLVLGSLATAAAVFLVSEAYLGRTMSAGEAILRAVSHIWPLIIASIMVGFLVGIGFILLIVPGIVALCGLLVSTQALVLEGLHASAALSRSWELTRGYRWKMLGLIIVVAIILLIPSTALVFLTGGEEMGTMGDLSTMDIVWAVIRQLVTTLIYPLLYCALTIAYYDLRVRKEGFDLELLESTLAHALPSSRGSELRDVPKPRTFG